MKLIKYYIIAVGFLALVNLGFYVSKNRPEEKQDLIIPIEKWEELLIDKWDFETKVSAPMKVIVYKGEVEYLKDGTFRRFITRMEFDNSYPYQHQSENSLDSTDADLIISGFASGLWKIGKGQYWEEQSTDCKMRPSYCSTSCKVRFNVRSHEDLFTDISCFGFTLNAKINYGEFSSEDRFLTLKKFTEGEILIEGRSTKNDTYSYSFIKKS